MNDSGLLRAVKMLESPNFMIDKSTGNAVGEIFYGSPRWRVLQQGSAAYSFVSQGTVVNLLGGCRRGVGRN